VRCRHLSWGAKKLLSIVPKRPPRWALPGRSTVCDILRHHGLVSKKRHPRHIGHPGKPTSQILAPHDVWSADFKGQFKTGDGLYCYPFTVADGYSRLLLSCQALSSTHVAEAKPVLAGAMVRALAQERILPFKYIVARPQSIPRGALACPL
jgi:putative transposase